MRGEEPRAAAAAGAEASPKRKTAINCVVAVAVVAFHSLSDLEKKT